MRTTLWKDVEAVARLARVRAAAEVEAGGEAVRSIRLPSGQRPAFPGRSDFDVFALGSAARTVPGDAHDHFLIDEETLALVIADVSGKGMPAALLTEVTRSLVRCLSCTSRGPGETLSRLNRVLHGADLGSMYVTIFLGWYHTPTGVVRYANAGHPRPLRLERGGRVRTFGRVIGPILGILDVESYPEAEGRLAPGDRLVLYTDGVTEALSPEGEMLGTDRLRFLLAENAGRPVDRLCRSVALAVEEFQAGRLHDDATLLALQRGA